MVEHVDASHSRSTSSILKSRSHKCKSKSSSSRSSSSSKKSSNNLDETGGGYQIDLRTVNIRGNDTYPFKLAQDRWSNVITHDISDIYFGEGHFDECGQIPAIVDDLSICARFRRLPRRILGYAGPYYYRTANMLPVTGIMVFDKRKIDRFNIDMLAVIVSWIFYFDFPLLFMSLLFHTKQRQNSHFCSLLHLMIPSKRCMRWDMCKSHKLVTTCFSYPFKTCKTHLLNLWFGILSFLFRVGIGTMWTLQGLADSRRAPCSYKPESHASREYQAVSGCKGAAIRIENGYGMSACFVSKDMV